MIGVAHRRQLDALGYVRLPGLLDDVVERIQDDFDAMIRREQLGVLACRQFMDGAPNGCETTARLLVPQPMGPGRPLRWLLEDPRVAGLADLLDGGAGYLTSLANLFNCNVHWHADSILAGSGRHLSVMIYLDELDEATGALRVIPGSHRPGPFRRMLLDELTRSHDPLHRAFGVPADRLPAHTLDVRPGDVVVLDVDAVHASFHGAPGRRLLSITFGPPIPEPDRARGEALLAGAARSATPDEVAASLGVRVPA